MKRALAVIVLTVGCGSHSQAPHATHRDAPPGGAPRGDAATTRYPAEHVGFAGSPWSVPPSTPVAGAHAEPALPAGLQLDPTSGAISGTPTTATAGALYRVRSADGTVDQAIFLEVVAKPRRGIDHVVDGAHGDDAADGSATTPWKTLAHAIQTLTPGETVFVRAGIYAEPIALLSLRGTADAPIVIRAMPGEHVELDAVRTDVTWVAATGVGVAPDEWVSSAPLGLGVDDATNRGFLAARPDFTRLLTYGRLEDLRATNEQWGQTIDAPGGVDTRGRRWPWTYMGPGLWSDPTTGIVHLRLAPTHNAVAGRADYAGPTDPTAAGVRIADRGARALLVRASSYLELHDLVLAGGGDETVHIEGSDHVLLDHVEIDAATMGLWVANSSDVRALHVRVDGGIPPWSFRSDFKDNYDLVNPDGTKGVENLVRKTSRTLVYIGDGVHRLELGWCELEHGHDIYLAGIDSDIHNCRVHDIHDESMFVSHTHDIDHLRIHDNVIQAVLSAISGAGGRTSGPRYFYRNVFDLRDPTASYRPGSSPTGVWRWGHLIKGDIGVAPFYFYDNTVLLGRVAGQAGMALFRSLEPDGVAKVARWFIDNAVVVGDAPGNDLNLSFVPDASYLAALGVDGLPLLRADGNVWVRPASAKAPLYRCLTVVRGAKCATSAFANVKDLGDATGWERHGRLVDDAGFRKLGGMSASAPTDDLRPASTSPLLGAGIALPTDFPGADRSAPPDAGALAHDAPPLAVGVDGRFVY